MSIGKLLIRVGLDINPLNKDLRNAERRLSRAGGRLANVGNELSTSLSLPIIGIGGAAIKAAADFEKLEKAMTAQMGSTEAARAEIEKLRDVAKNPGLGFEQAIMGSVRLQAVEFEAGLARRSLAAFGNALAIAGKDASDLDGVTLALSQIASKGKVSAEEINQLAERVPQIRKAMADAFGSADTEYIQGLQKAGLTTEQFVTGVVEQLEKLPRATGGIANSFNNFQTAVKLSLAQIGKAIDETVDVEQVMERITQSITGAVKWFGSLDSSTKKMIVRAAALVAAIGPLAKVIGSAKLVMSALYGVMLTVNKATGLLTIAQAALNAVMKANPVGIVITALTVLALAFATAYKKNEKFRAAINGLKAVAVEVLRVLGEAVSAFAEGFNKMKTGQIKAAAQAFKEGFIKSNPIGIASTEGQRFANAYRDAVKETLEKEQDSDPVTEPLKFDGEQVTDETTATRNAIQDLLNANPVVMDITARVKQERKVAKNKGKLYGDSFDTQGAEIEAITNGIESLLNEGVDPASAAVQNLVQDFKDLRAAGSMGVTQMLPSLNLIPPAIDSITEANREFATSNIEVSDTMQKMGEQLQAINEQGAVFGDALSINQEKINVLRQTIAALIEEGFDPMSAKVQNLVAEMQALQFSQAVGQMFTEMGQSMMSAAKQGETSLKSLALVALEAAGAFIQAKLMEAVAAAVADSFKKTGMFGLVIGAGVAAATGALFNGLMGKVSGAVALADGGIVNGPTNALIGEYSGARNNPEVVSPINKLEGMLNKRAQNISVDGQIRADGSDMLIVIENAKRRQQRTRGF
jgi:tape measure domain-containing protein